MEWVNEGISEANFLVGMAFAALGLVPLWCRLAWLRASTVHRAMNWAGQRARSYTFAERWRNGRGTVVDRDKTQRLTQLPVGAVFDTLRSDDPHRALARPNSDYTRHGMQAEARGFDFVHMSARIPQGSFNILRYGAAVEIRPNPFADF